MGQRNRTCGTTATAYKLEVPEYIVNDLLLKVKFCMNRVWSNIPEKGFGSWGWTLSSLEWKETESGSKPKKMVFVSYRELPFAVAVIAKRHFCPSVFPTRNSSHIKKII